MLRVRDLGRFSGPTVLLLHDSPIPAAHLEPLALVLCQSRRVLLPDLPGYGLSDPTLEPVGAAEVELERFLRQQDVTMVDVVGVGLGAYRALRLALDGDVLVRRLVTIGGFADLSDLERNRCRAYAEILHAGGDVCDVVIRRALPEAHRDAAPELVETLRGWIHEVSPTAWANELSACADLPNLRPRLATLRASLLALHGTRDEIVGHGRSTELASAMPNGHVELFECGHLLLDELTDRAIPRIRNFLTL